LEPVKCAKCSGAPRSGGNLTGFPRLKLRDQSRLGTTGCRKYLAVDNCRLLELAARDSPRVSRDGTLFRSTGKKDAKIEVVNGLANLKLILGRDIATG
jgi:hypothetical protein